MNWISEVVRPKIKTLFKRESPENLWIKCPETGQMVFHKDVEANGWVIPGSNYHLQARRHPASQDDLRFRHLARRAVAAGRGRSLKVPRREALHGPAQGRPRQDRPAGRLQDRLRPRRRSADDGRRAGFRLHGRLSRHGRRRGFRQRRRHGPRQADALRPVRGLGRRAHAGRHPVAHAIAAHHGRRAAAARRASFPTSSS